MRARVREILSRGEIIRITRAPRVFSGLLAVGIRALLSRRLRLTMLTLSLVVAPSTVLSMASLTRETYLYYTTNLEKFVKWDAVVMLRTPISSEELSKVKSSVANAVIEGAVFFDIFVFRISSGHRTLEISDYMTLILIEKGSSLVRVPVVEGSLSSRGIVVSRKLAALSGIRVGDRVKFVTHHAFGELLTVEFRVVGIADITWRGGLCVMGLLELLLRPMITHLPIKADDLPKSTSYRQESAQFGRE